MCCLLSSSRRASCGAITVKDPLFCIRGCSGGAVALLGPGSLSSLRCGASSLDMLPFTPQSTGSCNSHIAFEGAQRTAYFAAVRKFYMRTTSKFQCKHQDRSKYWYGVFERMRNVLSAPFSRCDYGYKKYGFISDGAWFCSFLRVLRHDFCSIVLIQTPKAEK